MPSPMSRPMSQSVVTIITVAYNSTAVVGKMLASCPADCPKIIVDNASTDPAALIEIADKYGAKVIRNVINQGFGRACNIGAAAADTPYLLFLNPDAQVKHDTVEAFLDSATRHPEASAFNPRILNRKGKLHMRRKSRLNPGLPKLSGPQDGTDIVIPTLSGAAIFVSHANFYAVGGFDPKIFLYHEDDDLAQRLQDIGPLRLSDAAVVAHLEGHGNERSPESAAFKAYHMARSRAYVFAKHKRPLPLIGTLLQSLFQFLSPDVLLSKRKRAKYVGFAKGAISAFKDGGRYSD